MQKKKKTEIEMRKKNQIRWWSTAEVLVRMPESHMRGMSLPLAVWPREPQTSLIDVTAEPG